MTPRGKPYPRAGWRRDHRPASAVNTRRSGSTSTAWPPPITIPFGRLISIATLAASRRRRRCRQRSLRSRTGTKPSPSTPLCNRLRQELTPPDEQLARRDVVIARATCEAVRSGLRRLRYDPQLLFPAPAPSSLNRCDHLDRRHRAMPIVTISIALRAISAEKQGSRQKTLTDQSGGVKVLAQPERDCWPKVGYFRDGSKNGPKGSVCREFWSSFESSHNQRDAACSLRAISGPVQCNKSGLLQCNN